jgi:lactoylglutathione lyase
MKFLHTMIRVKDLEQSIDFFGNTLGLVQTRRKDVEQGRFSLIFFATAPGAPEIELTYNWDQEEPYSEGRNFGHLAFSVENIYEYCEMLLSKGVTILRPPRDGYMAFIRTPDQISIELLQEGERLPVMEPWASMENKGTW